MNTTTFEAREWTASPRNVSPDGIHGDDRARQLGFEGGFVPGVALYEQIAGELMRQGCPGSRRVGYRCAFAARSTTTRR